ncbi:MAG: UvrD-helicase domain-containing protein [Alphaproteobacteria bacterium]|nr:UvrD-helicase domain-containing protein [Alphaproteobacteria bacterium]
MTLMLENLNPEQQAAVAAVDNGPVLVTAGAGTGKTTVLIAVMALKLLEEEKVRPWEILAITFTNKAAKEIGLRVQEKQPNTKIQWLGTFHSVCLRILRSNAHRVNLQDNFVIYDEDDQKSVIKSLVGEQTKKPAEYVEEFSRLKDKGLVAYQSKDKLFNAYNAELRRLNAVDFGDIILKVLELFDKYPDVLKSYQNQFKYILVDEFQDTNNAQMEFLKFLTKGKDNPNIYCVGDEDQSIYSWRGAEIQHIVNFKKTYPTATIKRLETNYRSTSNILNAANSLIQHNSDRYDKVLHPYNSANNGEPVYVLTMPTDRDEAHVIADAILRDTSGKFDKFAVLIRAGNLSRVIEEEFSMRGVPYRLIGATKFYDRMEIRDVIAYLRLLVYPFDDVSFLRVIGKPKRGFGNGAIEKMRNTGQNLMQAIKNIALTKKQQASADEFLGAFDFDWNNMSPSDAAQTLIERSGYLKMWSESKDSDAPDRLINIKELITSVISKYDTLPEFLEAAALMTTDDDNPDKAQQNNTDAVSIMTIHAAKGLEFDTVFLPAWEDGIFPNDKAIREEGAIEEERRLAYVAITRARKRCIISNAMSRMIFGSRQYNSPSRFITEIDNRFLDFQGGAPRKTYYTPYGGNIPKSYDAPRYNSTPKPVVKKIESLVGKLVTHEELGSGVVIEDGGAILTIAFKSKGIKKVAREFVK